MLRIKSPYPIFNRLAETKKISALWKRQNYTSHVNPFLHSRNSWFNRRRREILKGDSNQPPESFDDLLIAMLSSRYGDSG